MSRQPWKLEEWCVGQFQVIRRSRGRNELQNVLDVCCEGQQPMTDVACEQDGQWIPRI